MCALAIAPARASARDVAFAGSTIGRSAPWGRGWRGSGQWCVPRVGPDARGDSSSAPSTPDDAIARPQDDGAAVPASGLEKDAAFRSGGDLACPIGRSGVDRAGRDAPTDEELRELGTVRWAWRHSEAVIPALGRALNDAADRVKDRSVGLVEQLGADLGVAVHPQEQLREVVPRRDPPRGPA